jgi:hypothetical protein
MSTTKFAQLPGLQKAGKILELQEQINLHQKFCTHLLEIFNDLHTNAQSIHAQHGIELKALRFEKQADNVQIMCEWHMAQRIELEGELRLLLSAY